MKHLLKITTAVFLLGFTHASCNSDSTLFLDSFDGKATDLIGRQWELISFHSAEGKTVTIPADKLYTLHFETTSALRGRAADCNDYFASYEAEDDGAISLGRLSSSFATLRWGAYHALF